MWRLPFFIYIQAQESLQDTSLFDRIKSFLTSNSDVTEELLDSTNSSNTGLLIWTLIIGLFIIALSTFLYWPFRRFLRLTQLQISKLGRQVSRSEIAAINIENKLRRLIFEVKKINKIEKKLTVHYNTLNELLDLKHELDKQILELETELGIAKKKDQSSYDNKRKKKFGNWIIAIEKKEIKLKKLSSNIEGKVTSYQKESLLKIYNLIKLYANLIDKNLKNKETSFKKNKITTVIKNESIKETNPKPNASSLTNHRVSNTTNGNDSREKSNNFEVKSNLLPTRSEKKIRQSKPDNTNYKEEELDIEKEIFSNENAKTKDIEKDKAEGFSSNLIQKPGVQEQKRIISSEPFQEKLIHPPQSNSNSIMFALYSDIPGGFSAASVSDSNENNGIYMISVRQDIIEFEISTNPEAQSMALSNTQFYLKNACDYNEIPFENAKIITEKKGILKKMGNEYKIIKKAKLKFTQ